MFVKRDEARVERVKEEVRYGVYIVKPELVAEAMVRLGKARLAGFNVTPAGWDLEAHGKAMAKARAHELAR